MQENGRISSPIFDLNLLLKIKLYEFGPRAVKKIGRMHISVITVVDTQRKILHPIPVPQFGPVTIALAFEI